jgi:hypothetical protein
VIAAIGIVSYKGGVGEFICLYNEVPDAELIGLSLCHLGFLGGVKGRGGSDGEDVGQDIASYSGEEGAIHPTGVGDNSRAKML